DASGSVGPPLSKSDIMGDLGRQIVHEYQHLINASRRLYVNHAEDFEAPWLDEALSQCAEELLFQQTAPRQSRENLGSYDLSLTQQTLVAFADNQRPNLEKYRRFLSGVTSTSPLYDTPEGRGAGWSLLRYLIDRRDYYDYVSFTDLANSTTTGF